MKTSTLISLLTAFLLTVGTSIWLLKQDNSIPEPVEQPLLAEFVDLLPTLTQIEIADANGTVLLAEKVENEWRAKHLHSDHSLPVDMDTLAGLIDGLRSANKIEAKTQNAEQYSRLGVEPLAQAESTSKLISLHSAERSFEVLVGRQSTSGFGSFVRIPNAAQSWLIDQTIALPETASAWLVNPIPLIELDAIASVTRDTDDRYQIVSSANPGNGDETAQAQWQLVDLAEDEQLVFPGILRTTVNSLISTRFDRAIARETLAAEFNPQSEIVIKTKFDEQLLVQLYQDGDNFYVGYVLASKPWLEHWLFALSSFNYDQLNKGRSDLVEPPEMQEPPLTESAPVQ
ncbi:DUF4340 domain-containing protein [Alteromonas flava]|uniref:DUF4340 domain-containing protein n=1 Tax=Alteromonas flava TaxID=2048003 RepID=UPI000C28F1BD|nr:DUF4340 domain-containing protein [Alteromonas flava]